MSETTTTANMGLILPVPGVRSGLNAANDNNTAFGVLDLHDHSSGKGVRITPSGLNINSNLSFGSNSATGMKTVTFDNQSASLASSFQKCIYAVGGDLYFNNGSGTVIQLTSGGAINVASVQGISGLASPASASFSTPEFTFKSASTTYGKIVCADIKLFEATAGITNAVTLKSVASLAASYTLTLPSAVPAGLSYVSMDSSGNLATVSGDSIAAVMTATGANAIAATMTSTGTSSLVSTATAANADTFVSKVTSTGANAAAASTNNPNFGGKAAQENGKNLVVSNTNATNSLAIIRGIVNTTSGVIISGEGFTVTQIATGKVTINFSTSFGDVPAVTTSCLGGIGPNTAQTVTGASVSSVQIWCFSGASIVDNTFSFIAIGQRA